MNFLHWNILFEVICIIEQTTYLLPLFYNILTINLQIISVSFRNESYNKQKVKHISLRTYFFIHYIETNMYYKMKNKNYITLAGFEPTTSSILRSSYFTV